MTSSSTRSRIVMALFARLMLSVLPGNALVSIAPTTTTVKPAILESGEAEVYSFLSWNLLAPLFCTPKKYSYCDPTHLTWEYRRPKIVDKILRTSADVVFLQEVQVDTWESELMPAFEANYTGILQNVTGDHPVSCAMLIRRNKFRVLQTESRSRALISVVESLKGKNTMFLANVHLEAGMDQDEKRFCQVKSLLKRLRKHAAAFSAITDASLLVAGDFNMLRQNPVHHLLSTGEWNPSGGKEMVTRAAKSALKQSSQFPFLPVQEVLPSAPIHTMQTFSGGSVLDYIWVSPTVQAKSWVVDSTTRTEAKRMRYAWPSEEHPSDHLPVGAHFTIL